MSKGKWAVVLAAVCLVVAVTAVAWALSEEKPDYTLSALWTLFRQPPYQIVEVDTPDPLGRRERGAGVFLLDRDTGKVWQFEHLADLKKQQVFRGWRLCHVQGLHEEIPYVFRAEGTPK